MAKYIAHVTHPRPGVALVKFEATHGGGPQDDLFCNADDCPFEEGKEYDLADSAVPEEAERVKKAKK